MDPVEGARSFHTSGEAYDAFMGRYSRALAAPFADAAGVVSGQHALDVGCGPGALTGELVERLGAAGVSAVDPSPPFVASCAARHPGVDVRVGRAEDLPFDTGSRDVVLAQLVLHFLGEPLAAASELSRVTRPGGIVAACAWDSADEMEMLRLFWDAALTLDADAPAGARTLRFGREGEIAELFESAGLVDVVEGTLTVSSTYRDIEELWSGFLLGIGPAGSYCTSLDDEQRAALLDALTRSVGPGSRGFELSATARWASGRAPR